MGRVYDNQINENGAWITDDTTGHCYDKSLSEKLTEIFESHTVYDFGCGPGDYTKHFNECGIYHVLLPKEEVRRLRIY